MRRRMVRGLHLACSAASAMVAKHFVLADSVRLEVRIDLVTAKTPS